MRTVVSLRPRGKTLRNEQNPGWRTHIATRYETEWELRQRDRPVTLAGTSFPGETEVEHGQLETSLCVQAVFHAVEGLVKPLAPATVLPLHQPLATPFSGASAYLELLEGSTLHLAPGMNIYALSALHTPTLPFPAANLAN